MEAEDKGGCLGVQLDERGCLVESSIASIAVVTAAGELKSPPFDHALASTTLLRAFELARGAVGRAELPMLSSVEQAAVPLDEAYAASEVLSLGGQPCERVGALRSLGIVSRATASAPRPLRPAVRTAPRRRHRAHHLARRQADWQRPARPRVPRAVAHAAGGPL